MSAGLAQSSPIPGRVELDAARLLAHASVADARRVGHWWLVVPNGRGLRTLRDCGKAALVAQWQSCLAADATEPEPRWRLLEVLPPAGSEAEARCLQPIRTPILGDLEFPAPGALRCPVRVPLDLAVFDGHFPSIPIVPAVVQLGWAVDLCRAHLRPDAVFAAVVTAKFRRLVRPAMLLTLALDAEAASGLVRFEYCSAGTLVSTGRLRFEAGRA